MEAETIEDEPLTNDERESVNALVKKPAQDEFNLMERADETQILAELSGEVESKIQESWFYKLQSGAYGISWMGIKAYKNRCAEMGYPINVSIEPIEFTERIRTIYEGVEKEIYTPAEAKELLKSFVEEVHFKATAIDTRTGQTAEGIASQPLKEKGKDDEFAVRKAASKAKRNSIEEVMSAQVKAQLLLIAMRKGYEPEELKTTKFGGKRQLIQALEELSPPERIDAFLNNLGKKSLEEVAIAKLKSIVDRLKEE